VVVHDEPDQWRLEEAIPGKMIEPGMVMFWFGSDLFYANAAFFAEQARRLVNESPSPVRWLVIDCSAITSLDFSAGRALMDLQQDLAKAGVVLALTRIQPRHHGDLEQMGLVELIGVNRIFASRHACLEAYRSECLTGTG
jgi:MFS superfamily sulfate permease-like transporter